MVSARAASGRMIATVLPTVAQSSKRDESAVPRFHRGTTIFDSESDWRKSFMRWHPVTKRIQMITLATVVLVIGFVAVEARIHRPDTISRQLDALLEEARGSMARGTPEDLEHAAAQYREMIAVASAAERGRGYATGLNGLGSVYLEMGAPDSALLNIHRGHQISVELGHDWGSATALGNLGAVYARLGEPDSAAHYFQRAIELFSEHEGGANAVFRLEAQLARIRDTGAPD
jgi:hypothetical protein